MLAAAIVAVAMVAGAELTREGADRHRRVQALVEHLGTQTEAMSALRWKATAQQRRDPGSDPSGTYRQGLGLYRDILDTTRRLRATERTTEIADLKRGVDTMYAAALRTYLALKLRGVQAGYQLEATQLRPAITRLSRRVDVAAAHQRGVADHASARSRDALIGSLVVGLVLIVLLGLRFERLRRHAQQRASERRGEERLRALVEHSSDVFVVVGRDLRVRWHAASLAQLTGGSDPLVGEPLTALAHPDDRERLAALLRAARGAAEGVVGDVRVRDAHGASATPRATSCCMRSPGASQASCAPATPLRGAAGTSSRCCSRTSTTRPRPRPRPWPGASWTRWARRSPSRGAS